MVIFTALACIEVMLHIPAISDAIGFDYSDTTYRLDPVLSYRHVPNSRGLVVDRLGFDGYKAVVKYESHGIRADKEIEVPKPPGCYRVLLLGDSMVEAKQIPFQMTFGKVLEDGLAAFSKKFRFEVLNSGVGGWSTAIEYLYYKIEGVKLNPDLVILCFCLNDVTEDHNYFKRMKTDEADLPVAVAPPKNVQNRFAQMAFALRRHIRLYWLAKDFLTRPSYRTRAFKPGGIWGAEYRFTKEGRIARNVYALFNDNYSSEDEMDWDRTKRYIHAIKELADHNAADTLLVCIPLSHQVSRIQIQLGKQHWGKWKDHVEESTKPQEILRDFATTTNMHFLDLLPAFKKVGQNQKLFLEYDGHLNEQGHKLFAGTIADYVATNILKH